METYIKALQVQNFRNLSKTPFVFNNGINIIIGENANGKTNLLEAIYFAVNNKSFKKDSSFQHQLSIDCDSSEIRLSASITIQGEDISISSKFRNDGKDLYQNGEKVTKAKKINALFINPYESYIFFNNTTHRKKVLEHIFSLISIEHKRIYSRYVQQIRMRNKILSNSRTADLKMIKAIDVDLSTNIVKINHLRNRIVAEINQVFPNIFKEIFEEDLNATMLIKSPFNGLESEEVRKILETNIQEDLQCGFTKTCLQKDDLEFYIDNIDAKQCGSLGQQKILYISFLIAASSVTKKISDSSGIILIDDISNEIDSKRIGNIFKYLESINTQVFITTANNTIFEMMKSNSNFSFHRIKSGEIVH